MVDSIRSLFENAPGVLAHVSRQLVHDCLFFSLDYFLDVAALEQRRQSHRNADRRKREAEIDSTSSDQPVSSHSPEERSISLFAYVYLVEHLSLERNMITSLLVIENKLLCRLIDEIIMLNDELLHVLLNDLLLPQMHSDVISVLLRAFHQQYKRFSVKELQSILARFDEFCRRKSVSLQQIDALELASIQQVLSQPRQYTQSLQSHVALAAVPRLAHESRCVVRREVNALRESIETSPLDRKRDLLQLLIHDAEFHFAHDSGRVWLDCISGNVFHIIRFGLVPLIFNVVASLHKLALDSFSAHIPHLIPVLLSLYQSQSLVIQPMLREIAFSTFDCEAGYLFAHSLLSDASSFTMMFNKMTAQSLTDSEFVRAISKFALTSPIQLIERIVDVC